MTPNALRSIGLRSVVLSGSPPSSISPSGFTTRPMSSFPTGMERMFPVAFTVIPSFTFVASPRMTTFTVSSSRLSAMPRSAPPSERVSSSFLPSLTSNITISDIIMSSSPSISAIPSAAETTTPIFSERACGVKSTICFFSFSTMCSINDVLIVNNNL